MSTIATISEEARKAVWLAERKTCITGTEISAIFGQNPWMKPIDVWADKMGYRAPFEPNDAMRAGKRFEHAILEEHADRAGRSINFADPYGLIKVPGFPLLGATLDATWADTGCPLDAKNIRFKEADWGDEGSDEFPTYYQMQLHLQAMATEKPSADLAVCFTGQDFVRYTLQHDPEIDDLIKEEAEAWWKKHILGNVAPEPDGSESFTTYLKTRFKRNQLDLIDCTDEARAIAVELQQAKTELQRAEHKKALEEQQLKVLIGNHEGIRGLCTWKNNRDSDQTDWHAAFEAFWVEYAAQHGLDDKDKLAHVATFTTTKPGARVLRLSK